MVKPFPSKTHIGNHALHPETLMLNYGYDPQLSEGAVKPPVFLTSTFVFRTADETNPRPVLVITSGANRVDPALVEAVLGVRLRRADAAYVREATGFAIGGVAPVGHRTPPLVLMDEDLLALDPVWAAAGAPHAVFRTSAAELRRMTGARTAAIRAAP